MKTLLLSFAAALSWAQTSPRNTNDWLLPNLASRLSVRVVATGATAGTRLASIPIAEARKVAPEFPGRVAIAMLSHPQEDPIAAEPIATQMLDLDGDGVPDNLLFPISLDGASPKRVDIYYSTTISDDITWPKKVQAKHSYGYNREVAALESEIIGYRTYGGFFLDVMGRLAGHPGLYNDVAGYAPVFLNLGGGRDVLHIGQTLGLGGVFLRHGDKIFQPPMNVPTYAHKPSPEMVPHYRVVASGPIRAIVEASLDRWQLNGDVVRIVARYAIDQDQSLVRCDVTVSPIEIADGNRYEVGTGIHDLPAQHPITGDGHIVLSGRQNERDGDIGLALFYDASQYLPPTAIWMGKESNHAVISKATLAPGHSASLQYFVAAAWSGSGIQNPSASLLALDRKARIRVQIDEYRFSRTPHPEKLDAEAQ